MRRNYYGQRAGVKNYFRQFTAIKPENRPAVRFQIPNPAKLDIYFFNGFKIGREKKIMNAINSFNARRRRFPGINA